MYGAAVQQIIIKEIYSGKVDAPELLLVANFLVPR